MAKHSNRPTSSEVSVENLLNRARKFRTKGELRKTIQTLREACLRDEHCAWLWTLYGAMLSRSRRIQEAQQAYQQALWLRKMSGDQARMRSTQALLNALMASSSAA